MREGTRRLLLGGGAVGVASVLLALQRGRANGEAHGAQDVNEVLKANERFYSGLNLVFEGDLSPMEEAWSHADDVTLMDPFGGRQEGWEAIHAELARSAAQMAGGEVHPEDVQVRTDGGMAYIVCAERGFNRKATGSRVMVDHRATNVFRREGGTWRMVHHHTDVAPRLQKAFRSPEE